MMPTPRDRRRFLKTGLALTAAAQVLPGARAVRRDPDRERHYGGNPRATRYSPLDQIKPSNVRNLKAPRVHRTGDGMERPATPIECESVVIDGVMYIQTAQLQTRGAIEFSRAVTFWQNPEDRAHTRIDAPDGGLQCLNAKAGDLKPGFARERSLDLVKGSDPDRTDQSGRLTSPRCVYEEIIVCGVKVGEGRMRRQGTSEAVTRSPANSAGSSTLCPNPANSPTTRGAATRGKRTLHWFSARSRSSSKKSADSSARRDSTRATTNTRRNVFEDVAHRAVPGLPDGACVRPAGLTQVRGSYGRLDDAALGNGGKIARWANVHPDIWKSRPVKGDIGIVFAPEGALQLRAAGQHVVLRRVRGAYMAFSDSNIQSDWVHIDDIGEYRAIYLPFPVMLTAKTAAHLRAYVENGGVLISEGLPGYFGDGAHAGPTQPNLGLADVFGAAESDVDFSPDLLENLTVRVGNRTIGGRFFKQVYRPTTGKAIGAYSGGAVAAVENRFAKGRTILIGTFPGAAYFKKPTADARAWFASLLSTKQGITLNDPTSPACTRARVALCCGS
jgi:hypothetical protein